MKIKMATMTGANDATDPKTMLAVSERYPFVEWGILVSESQTGSTRFPTHEWISKMLAQSAGAMNLSAHVCGQWVRDICKGEWTLPSGIEWRGFNRLQLNFHGYLHMIRPEFLTLLRSRVHQFILQLDGVNDKILQDCLNDGADVVPIFDCSHGAGVLPDEWPKPIPKVLCTYAGGLGPDNLKDQLKRISDTVGDAEICIDMETRVRSDDDTLFDLIKVVRALEIAANYVR